MAAISSLSEAPVALVSSVRATTGVLAGVGAQHPDAELVVGLGVAVCCQGYGDHGGVREPARGGEAGPQEPHGRQGRGAVADQGDEHHPAVEGGEAVDLLLVEGVGDRHPGGAGGGLPGLGRGQVEPAERAVLGVGQGRDRPVGRDPREGESLGVDELDLGLRREVRRAASGSPATRAR